MPFCFEALESAKISSCEPVSSQKYENGYRTKFVTLQKEDSAILGGPGLCFFFFFSFWLIQLSVHVFVREEKERV